MFQHNDQYFAFNIWDQDSIKAVMDAAKASSHDVILQTSSQVFEKMEKKLIREFVTSYSNSVGIKAYLHLDHCRDLKLIKKAVDAGWDSVMMDASHLPLEENIRLTERVCEYAHANGILVEAEVGQIRGVEENISVDGLGIADFRDVVRFLEASSTDLIAVAIGTCHGLYKKPPHIQYGLIKQIGRVTDRPFVVHGGSGLTDGDLLYLLSIPCVRKINISTELKQAFRVGILRAESRGLLEQEGFDVAAVKQEIYDTVRETAEKKLRLLLDRERGKQT